MIGDKIKARREELGLTQSDLEQLTGIGYRMISNYEKNNNKPNDETILLLMKALKCDANYFFDIAPKSSNIQHDYPEQPRIEKSKLTSRQNRIVELFEKLTEPQQDNIIGRAELLAEMNEEACRKEENA